MPRFVILRHDFPEPHWDFMLEHGPVLKSWRLASLPAHGEVIAAKALPDHRPHYLDYEGPVSGNRGTVVRCDRGDYRTEDALDADTLRIDLLGETFQGTAILRHTQDADWVFQWFVRA